MENVCFAATTVHDVIQLFVLCIIFVIVLFMAYFAARLVGGFQTNVQAKNNIKIIETVRISNNKCLQIIKIGESFYLIGVGKDEIHYLTKLDSQDVHLTETSAMNLGSFKDILSNLKKNEEKKEK